MKEVVRLEDIMPLLRDAIRAEAPFIFFPRGTSMLPMIRQGLDSVSLVSVSKRKPQKGEVILYRRNSGEFILHRIIRVNKNKSFDTCGDSQFTLERGVPEDSVTAVLDGFFRENKWVSADDKKYNKYVKKIIRTRWVRYIRAKIARIVKRVQIK
ncbi:MAG: S24/S26 family peptidase [Clostridia bacterium]|nr:S24/S26 family peptidase [Clostridia bacterium]